MDQLEELIDRHRPLLRQLCKVHFTGEEDIEDLEGEVILTVCRRFATYDASRGTFGTWLGAIVRNEASDLRRKAARQPLCVPNTLVTERLIHQAAGLNGELYDGELDGIDAQQLPSLFRQAFSLVKLTGLSYSEAAQEMGRSEASIRTFVWKARRLMRSSVAVA